MQKGKKGVTEIAAKEYSFFEKISQLEDENQRLRKENQELQAEKIRLIDRYSRAEERVRELERASSQKQKEESSETHKALFLEEFSEAFRVCLVGGPDTWEKRVKETFPKIRCLGNEPFFDEKAIRSSEFLLINTNCVGHKSTIKAKNIAAAANIPFMLTSSNNFKVISGELECFLEGSQ